MGAYSPAPIIDKKLEKKIIDRIVKPTIKKYLYSYAQTGFLRINADEAATAIFLPVQRFKKASEAKVYSDSRRII